MFLHEGLKFKVGLLRVQGSFSLSPYGVEARGIRGSRPGPPRQHLYEMAGAFSSPGIQDKTYSSI